MKFSLRSITAVAAACLPFVHSLADTDSISDADPAQSGYLPNHNMDPAVVDSAQFGQLWKRPFNALEQFYAKPLVYTPVGGTQIVFIASSQNYIRTLDAKTGTLINVRQVAPFFKQSDIPCNDIPNNIGITGTPVIDPATNIVYFFAKTYIANYRAPGATGVINGVYYLYAVDITTLQDVPGFPLLMDGSVADNDPRKYFLGGNVLQRPSLTKIGNVIFGAFGAHCDLYNYTGVILGVDFVQKTIVTNFVTESGPLVAQTNDFYGGKGGGEAGVWMAGMGLATDGNRLFFVSGNGDAHENDGTPAAGSSGCRTLGQAAVKLNVDAGTGKATLGDYFQPFGYKFDDGADVDFGSGGLSLLDPTVFNGTTVKRLGVAAGKSGKIYVLNADNLGGYKLGPGQTDGVVQVISPPTPQSVFGGAGSYPLEGGYFYFTPIGFATYAYKFGLDANGQPVFTRAGQTKELSAGRIGVGTPTVTSYKGQAGSGIVWMTDPNAGLRAWHAVPGDDGYLKTILLPQVGGANKFQRPAFGDSRLYVTDSNGVLYCLGSPVSLPLNCTSPVDFGSVAIGTSKTTNVTCTANIPITSVIGVTTGDQTFQVDNTTLPKGPIAAGTVFSFPVLLNLTRPFVSSTANTSFPNITPGVKSTPLTLYTINGIAGYSTLFPLSLRATEVSQAPFLALTPPQIAFGGIVLGNDSILPTATGQFVITNKGIAPLVILGYAYTNDDVSAPVKSFTNVTTNGTSILGYGFTSTNIPALNTTVPGGSALSVVATFQPINGTGLYTSNLFVWTNGGTGHSSFVGSASTAPIAELSIGTAEGGWLPPFNLLMDFGRIAPSNSSSRQLRICNRGGAALTIEKSKPPSGPIHTSGLDLVESQVILPATCAYGTVTFTADVEPPNVPDTIITNQWTLNTNDPTFGIHVVQCQGTVVDRNVGPLLADGTARYKYLGCYLDSGPPAAARLLTQTVNLGQLNENGLCQQKSLGGGYVFAGTEYNTECWSGNVPPGSQWLGSDRSCAFSCPGDLTQACGGLGGYIVIYYDSTRYTPGNNSVPIGGTPPPGSPITVAQTGNFVSLGCYSEATAGRALTGRTTNSVTNTIESCAIACAGFGYMGTEFGQECYCGNSLGAGSVSSTGCTMTCAGNATEYCGGPNRLNMYQINGTLPVTSTAPGPAPTPTPSGAPVHVAIVAGFTNIGCYTESTTGRALTGAASASDTMTVDICAASCVGYTYFGTEYARECFCGNSLSTGSVLSTNGGCTMTCAGNSTTYCGGPNRLDMFRSNGTMTSTISSSMPTLTSSGNSTVVPLPTPTGPIVVPQAAGFASMGCYTEATNMRALSATSFVNASMTVENCAAFCGGYQYMGVEYSTECFCGNVLNTGSVLATVKCTMLCGGNSGEFCGGPNLLNLYSAAPSNGSTTKTSTSTAPGPTSPVTVPGNANFAYLACYVEPTTGRALPNLVAANSSMTVEMCLAACSQYTYVGLEYASECWCGNVLNANAVPASTESQCNMACAGNKLEYCGAGNRVSLYTKKAAVIATIAPASNTTNTTTTSAPTAPVSPSISPNSTSTAPVSPSISPNSAPTAPVSLSISPNSTSTAPVSPSISPNSTTTAPTTVATFTPTAGQIVSGFAYVGCANETTPRALVGASITSSANMTNAACQAFCVQNNYGLAATEAGGSCFCGNGLQSFSAIGQTGCTSACSGNAAEICGGVSGNSKFLSVWNSTSTAIPPTTVKQVGAYLSQGCFAEPLGGNLTSSTSALKGISFTNHTAMTVETCVGYCQNSGYTLAGVEYGQVCYCDNQLSNSSTSVSESNCNMLCTGNSREFCGAYQTLGVYKQDSTSVASDGTPLSTNQDNTAHVIANTTTPAP